MAVCQVQMEMELEGGQRVVVAVDPCRRSLGDQMDLFCKDTGLYIAYDLLSTYTYIQKPNENKQ
jgi:hypothetical protein